jgi:hypothetical protein
MMARFSFEVLHAQRLPASGIVAVAVRVLDGMILPGATAVATIGGRTVELRVNSVALEGGRGVVDGTRSFSVATDESNVDVLVGVVFRGDTVRDG